MYFFFAMVTLTYQFVYMHSHKYETGGALWQQLSTGIVVSMAFAQLVLSAVVLTQFTEDGDNPGPRKGAFFKYQEALVVGIQPIAMYFFERLIHRTFDRCTQHVALETAIAIDRKAGLLKKHASG